MLEIGGRADNFKPMNGNSSLPFQTFVGFQVMETYHPLLMLCTSSQGAARTCGTDSCVVLTLLVTRLSCE